MWINFDMDSGDYSDVKLQVTQGHLPDKQGEIALSSLNAKRLNLNVSDDLVIRSENVLLTYEVVGIYQDITSGGLTSKIYIGSDHPIKSYAYYITLNDDSSLDLFMSQWQTQYPNTKVLQVKELMNQTLGSITDSLNQSVLLMIVISFIILSLVSVLFLILQVHKNSQEESILLAIGYESKQLRNMYTIKSLYSLGIAGILALLLTYIIGEGLMSVILSMMGLGITSLKFIVQPYLLVMVLIIMPVVVVYMVSRLITKRLENKMIRR